MLPQVLRQRSEALVAQAPFDFDARQESSFQLCYLLLPAEGEACALLVRRRAPSPLPSPCHPAVLHLLCPQVTNMAC